MHRLEIQEKDIVSLEELILREKNRINKKVIKVEYIDKRDKREDHNIKIINAQI